VVYFGYWTNASRQCYRLHIRLQNPPNITGERALSHEICRPLPEHSCAFFPPFSSLFSRVAGAVLRPPQRRLTEGSSPSAAIPVVSSIAPANVAAGSTAITLTVTGSNFQSNSVIQVDGTKEATSFVNSGELTTTLPASQVASGAQLQVQVLNGSVSSAASSSQQITVTNPAPVVTSLTPSAVGPASSPKIAINGTGFCTDFCTAVERQRTSN